MAIIFDKEGNLIRDIINYKPKHDDLTNDLINETFEKYFCSKCDTYHKRNIGNKINQTFIKHISLKIEVSDYYVYKKKLKRFSKGYNIKKHKLSVGSRKQ